MATNAPQENRDGTEEPGVLVPMDHDYSQRPQKPIRLKPGIAQEPPGPATRRSPAESVEPAPPSGNGAQSASAQKARKARGPAGSSSWAIKGVSSQTRRLAENAAARAGMPLSEWLDMAIKQAAAGPVVPRSADTGHGEIVIHALKEINERVRVLEQKKTLWDVLTALFGGSGR